MWDRVRTEAPWALPVLSASKEVTYLVDSTEELATDRHQAECAEARGEVWMSTLRPEIDAGCGPAGISGFRDDTRAYALAAITQAARTMCRQAPDHQHTLAGVLTVGVVAGDRLDDTFRELKHSAHRLENQLASAFAAVQQGRC